MRDDIRTLFAHIGIDITLATRGRRLFHHLGRDINPNDILISHALQQQHVFTNTTSYIKNARGLSDISTKAGRQGSSIEFLHIYRLRFLEDKKTMIGHLMNSVGFFQYRMSSQITDDA